MAVAANVSGIINLTASFTQVQATGVIGSSIGGGSQSFAELISIADQLTNATGAAKTCDQMYAAQLTLSAAATTLHFETATAKDPAGNTLAMLRIRLLIVQNLTATAGFDVKVEASATNAIAWLPPSTAPLLARANGGLVLIYDPNSSGAGAGNVVGATTDGLTLDPGANTCTVNVLVVGDSVA